SKRYRDAVGEEQLKALTSDFECTESEELEENPAIFPEIVDELTSASSSALSVHPRKENSIAKAKKCLQYNRT
ncbi:MAG TPA: hypothetical protein PKW79_05995, partial [Rhabdochlamydiaceae bacterium]|nr:hypothetical protein [Rhabdochlamydiaceae bacterium]